MLRNRGGQLTVIVIIAAVIALGVIAYALYSGGFLPGTGSTEFDPVFNYYSECIKEQAKIALDLSGSQGGHMNTEYIPGSNYAPFSNQLNFLGIPVPYWYYLTSNGLVKQNVPSKSQIEKEIADYIQNNLVSCDFEQFYSGGLYINFSNPSVSVKINRDNVDVKVKNKVSVSSYESSATKSDYSVRIESKFGTFYDDAKAIYEKELDDAFLENYSMDFVRTYAPVDGVEVGCGVKVWKIADVENRLKEAFTANIAALKFKGDYYVLKNKTSNYFVIDQDVDSSVNLVYSSQWPTRVEIAGQGVSGGLMVAKPIGNDDDFGTMGFCYAPYHFVYDVSYPVMIQLYNNEELFQFPVVVVVDKNMPRNSLLAEYNDQGEVADFCEYLTQSVNLNLLDSNLNSVNDKLDISYQCFNQKCSLGQSANGKFIGKAPACVNGYIITEGDGYAKKSVLFSSNRESSADIILDKLYNVSVDLSVGGHSLSGMALVSFAGENGASAFLPDSKNMKLSEGLYNVTVYVYGNSSLTIPASTKTQCTKVSESGLLGIFGGTKEQCYDISIPETKIEYGLIGGGKVDDQYILPEMLSDGVLKIEVSEFPKPSSLEQLQYNYEIFNSAGVSLE